MVLALEKSGKDLSREKFLAGLDAFKDIDIGGLVLNLAADNHQALDKVFMTQIQDGKITKLQ